MEGGELAVAAAPPGRLREPEPGCDDVRALRNLYAQAVRDQWDPDDAIDWSHTIPFGCDLPADPGLSTFLDSSIGSGGRPVWNRFRWEHQIWLVSQFFHGEQAALTGAARLALTQSSLEGKQAAAAQVMDEARHAEVFGRYLAKCGEATPYGLSPPFAELVASAMGHVSWDMAALGVQVLIEGFAVASFRLAETTLHDPLIRSIVRLVHRDEARHTALGMISLGAFYRELGASERRERADFIAAAAEVAVRRLLLEEVWERVGVTARAGAAFAAQDPVMSGYRRAVFAKVIGTVRRLGLLDERLRRDLEGLGYPLQMGSAARRHARQPATTDAAIPGHWKATA